MDFNLFLEGIIIKIQISYQIPVALWYTDYRKGTSIALDKMKAKYSIISMGLCDHPAQGHNLPLLAQLFTKDPKERERN
jgi:hypothetical protein